MSKDIRPSTVQQLYVYFLRPALLERDAIALERVQGAGLGLSLVLLSTFLRRSCLNSWTGRRYVGDERSFVLDCFTAYCRLALLLLIPACFHLHRRTPPPSASFLRKPKQLILPRVLTSKYVKSFFFRSALLWNTLPAQLQNIACYHKFKTRLKAHWSAHKYSTQFCLLT